MKFHETPKIQITDYQEETLESAYQILDTMKSTLLPFEPTVAAVHDLLSAIQGARCNLEKIINHIIT